MKYHLITDLQYPAGGGEEFGLETVKYCSQLGIKCKWITFANPNGSPDLYKKHDTIVEEVCEYMVLPQFNIEKAVQYAINDDTNYIHYMGNHIGEISQVNIPSNINVIIGFHYWSELLTIVKKIYRSRIDSLIQDDAKYKGKIINPYYCSRNYGSPYTYDNVINTFFGNKYKTDTQVNIPVNCDHSRCGTCQNKRCTDRYNRGHLCEYWCFCVEPYKSGCENSKYERFSIYAPTYDQFNGMKIHEKKVILGYDPKSYAEIELELANDFEDITKHINSYIAKDINFNDNYTYYVPSQYSYDIIDYIFNSKESKIKNLEIITPYIDSCSKISKNTDYNLDKNIYITTVNCNEHKSGRVLLEILDNCPKARVCTIKTCEPSNTDMLIEQKLKDPRHIFIDGFVNDINEILDKTRILLIPSLIDETFCRIAVEASSKGIPIATSGKGNLQFFDLTILKTENNNYQEWINFVNNVYDDHDKLHELSERSLTCYDTFMDNQHEFKNLLDLDDYGQITT